MKDHKRMQREITYDLEGNIPHAIEVLQEFVDKPAANLCIECWDDYVEINVTWWEPLNEVELAKAKEERRKERERKAAAAKRIEEVERATLTRLKEKYESNPD
jgi:rubrerythrin